MVLTYKSASVKLKAAGIAAVKAKATGNAKMSPPAKPTTPLRGHNPYQNSPTKGANDNKKNHNIIILMDDDDTPYGWAFENFYIAKEFVKHLSNKNDAMTFLGGLEFKSFSNLTTMWLKTSSLGENMWVIHIDTTLDGTIGCFPMDCHTAYANKIARAMLQSNMFDGGKVDVINKKLSASVVEDLDSYFSTQAFDYARDAIFHEAIKEADPTIEDKI
jgi:hypothetical protein